MTGDRGSEKAEAGAPRHLEGDASLLGHAHARHLLPPADRARLLVPMVEDEVRVLLADASGVFRDQQLQCRLLPLPLLLGAGTTDLEARVEKGNGINLAKSNGARAVVAPEVDHRAVPLHVVAKTG
jgi:hypothetical protein